MTATSAQARRRSISLRERPTRPAGGHLRPRERAEELDGLALLADTATTPDEVDATIRRLEAARRLGDRAKPHMSLGVLYSRKRELGRAERAFQEAVARSRSRSRPIPPWGPSIRRAKTRPGRARVQDSGRHRADRLADPDEAFDFYFPPKGRTRPSASCGDDPEGAGLSARLASPRRDRAQEGNTTRASNLTGPSQEELVRPGGAVPAGARTAGQAQHR